MPGCAAPLVKSRTSARIRRNLNQILCFHDAHGFSEIGFVRRILPISPVPLSSSACFFTPSGQLKAHPVVHRRVPGLTGTWATSRNGSKWEPFVRFVVRLRSVYPIRPQPCWCSVHAPERSTISCLVRARSVRVRGSIGQSAGGHVEWARWRSSLYTRCAEFKISLTQDLQFADVFVATSCAARRKKSWKIFCVVH